MTIEEVITLNEFNEDTILNKLRVDVDVDKELLYSEYIKEFEQWLNTNYINNISLSLIKVLPTNYSHVDDKMQVSLTCNSDKLLIHTKDYKGFKAWVREHTMQEEGYIAYYTYKDVLYNKNGIYNTFMLNYLLDVFNSKD